TETEVLPVLDELDPGEVALRRGRGLVLGAVVDDDHIGCRIVVLLEARETRDELVDPVPGEDDDRHAGRRRCRAHDPFLFHEPVAAPSTGVSATRSTEYSKAAPRSAVPSPDGLRSTTNASAWLTQSWIIPLRACATARLTV